MGVNLSCKLWLGLGSVQRTNWYKVDAAFSQIIIKCVVGINECFD